MIEAVLSVFTIVLLTIMLFKVRSFERNIPDVEQILTDVGQDIGEQLSGIFKEPMVKRAMSTLGKQSGVARADSALRERVADKVIGENIMIKKAMEWLDITPVEGLQLLNDPLFGPLIQKAISGGLRGLAGFSSGHSPGHNPSNVPSM